MTGPEQSTLIALDDLTPDARTRAVATAIHQARLRQDERARELVGVTPHDRQGTPTCLECLMLAGVALAAAGVSR